MWQDWCIFCLCSISWASNTCNIVLLVCFRNFRTNPGKLHFPSQLTDHRRTSCKSTQAHVTDQRRLSDGVADQGGRVRGREVGTRTPWWPKPSYAADGFQTARFALFCPQWRVLRYTLFLKTRSPAITETARAMLCVMEYFATLLEIAQGRTKWHHWVGRV